MTSQNVRERRMENPPLRKMLLAKHLEKLLPVKKPLPKLLKYLLPQAMKVRPCKLSWPYSPGCSGENQVDSDFADIAEWRPTRRSARPEASNHQPRIGLRERLPVAERTAWQSGPDNRSD